MMVAHVAAAPGAAAFMYAHHYMVLGVYDAEFFVPLSGFLFGFIARNRALDAGGFKTFAASRLWRVYLGYLAAMIPSLAAAILADPSRAATVVLNALLFQNGGPYTDILVIYFVCIALLWLFAPVTPFQRFLFVASSLSILALSTRWGGGGLFGSMGPFVVFDIAAWQAPFALFFLIGLYHEPVARRLASLGGGSAAVILVIAAGAIIASRIHMEPHLAGLSVGEAQVNWRRLQLHWTFWPLMAAAWAGLAVVALARARWLAAPAAALAWWFGRPWLQAIGRRSLSMFVLHVYLVFVLGHVASAAPQAATVAAAFVCIALFIAAPRAIDWFAQKRNARAFGR